MPPRSLATCCVAELIGTFLLVLFGCGSVHVAVLADGLVGLWQVAMVWGGIVMLAIYLVGGVSGAHINPAITLGLAAWGLFPRSRVLAYVVAQLAGAILAAATLYVLFGPFLAAKEAEKQVVRGTPGSIITATCYGEYFPNPGGLAGGTEPLSDTAVAELNRLVSEPVACLAEILGTAVLALVVVAVTDKRQATNPDWFAPVLIGMTIAVLICLIAPLTQACFNPARDFGPRLVAYLAGWGEVALPGPRGIGFLTVYIISPIVGSVIGIGVYRLALMQPVSPEFEGAHT